MMILFNDNNLTAEILVEHTVLPNRFMVELDQAPECGFYAKSGCSTVFFCDCRNAADHLLVLIGGNEMLKAEDCRNLISELEQRLINQYHPENIIVWTDLQIIKQVLQTAGYLFLTGYFKKNIEPYRYQINDSCFDKYGFIIDQGHMKCIPFGSYNTKDKGCGWIAAYNLLKINGMEKSMNQIVIELGEYGVFGKKFGQDILSLYRYLQKQGLEVRIMIGNGNILRKMKQCSSGIILYTHRSNSHYAAFQRRTGGKLQFYNAVYGKKYHLSSPDEFVKRYVFIPAMLLIYVD